MKKFVMLLLCIVLFPNACFASDDNTHLPQTEVNVYEIGYPVEILDKFPKSKALTYEEMYEKLKSENHDIISLNEFKNSNFVNNMLKSYNSQVLYQTFYMKTETFTKNFKTYKIQPLIIVGLEYRSSSSPSRIASLNGGTIYTGGGADCIVNGKLKYFLESGNSFSTFLSGDVYKGSGSMTYTGGGNVGIGKVGEVNISASYTTSNYLKNIYSQDRYYSSSLDN